MEEKLVQLLENLSDESTIKGISDEGKYTAGPQTAKKSLEESINFCTC